MESELWIRLYAIVTEVAKSYPRKKAVTYSDAWILLVYLWSVLHDRPRKWACDARNWPVAILQAAELPSQSRLSERLRTLSLVRLYEAVMIEARSRLPVSLLKCIDSKPLVVGSHSKDKDAKWGQAGHGKARGYKICGIYDGAAVDGWRLGPMNMAEPDMAVELIPQTAAWSEGYLLGDAMFDSNRLHKLASEHGLQLLAPRKKPHRGISAGHEQQPPRLRSIHLLEGQSAFGRSLYACRVCIEQRLGQAGNLGCGLAPLPNWVRTPRRVALWVAGKLLIVACWNHRKQGLAA